MEIKPKITPITSSNWGAGANYIQEDNKLFLKYSSIALFLRIAVPLFIGFPSFIYCFIYAFEYFGLIEKATIIEIFFIITPACLVCLVSLACFYISFSWFRNPDSGRVVFKRNSQKLYIDLGQHSDSINRVIKFKDISQLQIIECVFKGVDDKHHTELNLVLINNERINLLTSSYWSVVNNAEKVSRFIDKPIKLINYGDITHSEK